MSVVATASMRSTRSRLRRWLGTRRERFSILVPLSLPKRENVSNTHIRKSEYYSRFKDATLNGWISNLTLLATLGTGLIAGTFFAFSNFVMKGLERLPVEQGAAAMRSINVTVLNPLFLALFAGTGLVCLGLALHAGFRLNEPGARFLLVGGLLYVVGTFGVTMALNVPLNDALAADAGTWERYLTQWTLWNHVRTSAALLACLTLAWGNRSL